MRTLVASTLLGLAACSAHPMTSPDVVAGDAFDAAADAVPSGDAPTGTDVPTDYVRPPDITRTNPESVLAPQRASCMFEAGAWPASTLGTDIPIGTDIKIDHVLVLMQENRSFDHYYSQLPANGQPDVEVPPAGWFNPRADDTHVLPFHDTQHCIVDVDHSWAAEHQEWANGANTGFVTANNPMGERAMGYEDATDIPFYYAVANTFAIADHYHCALLGPTWPNRLYMMAATSYGLTDNELVGADLSATHANHIFRELDAAGLDWKTYADGLSMVQFYPYYGIRRSATAAHITTHDQLFADLTANTLPPFAFIEPAFTGDGGTRYDEHPPGTPQAGEHFAEQLIRALMASPSWATTALFINYDENGGFADHVPPPAACPPDDSAPVDSMGHPIAGAAFDHHGFRVPMLLISPWARRHFVSHTVYDHASILRFVEARFGLPAMTRRDANATPPTDMFDFTAPPSLTAPTLPTGGLDPAVQAACTAAFPASSGL